MTDLLGIRECAGCGLEKCICILPDTNIPLYICTWREREGGYESPRDHVTHVTFMEECVSGHYTVFLLVCWSIDFTIQILMFHFRLREF